MITEFLLVLVSLITSILIVKNKITIIEKTNDGHIKQIQIKPLLIYISICILILCQPFNIYKVEAGYKGLKINLIGDNRGVSTINEVSGFVIYNKYIQEVYQIPLDQRHIDYGKNIIVAKGGFSCEIYPSFSYSVKESGASNMFVNLRSTYKEGGLKSVEQSWLKNAIIGAINDVSNTFVIDDIFNDRQKFEHAIFLEVNKRAGRWFEITQLKSNILPPVSIKHSIEAKAKAVQDAVTSEAQANAAKADAQRKIALAKGDSATSVIRALAEAKSTKLKQQELTPLYIEYMKINKWNGQLPTTSAGNSSLLLNIK